MQLRPVTHRANLEVTVLLTKTYGRFCGSSASLAESCRRASRTQIRCVTPRNREPLDGAHGMREFIVWKISCAKTFPGSCASTSSHRDLPKTKTAPAANVKKVERNMIKNRGGNDFLSGMRAASSTLTLGVSFASCTFASSYC